METVELTERELAVITAALGLYADECKKFAALSRAVVTLPALAEQWELTRIEAIELRELKF